MTETLKLNLCPVLSFKTQTLITLVTDKDMSSRILHYKNLRIKDAHQYVIFSF